jgi:lipid-A-disaccharide synthase
MTNEKCVMIIAGEASGDLHGSNLVRAMKQKNNSLSFCGIGGKLLRDAGVNILMDASEISVVGITEVLSKAGNIWRGMSLAKETLRCSRPDLLILIDFPDFNLRIAAIAKRLGIPVLYYISPQVWAWRQGRVKKIAKIVDHIAVIFPFEEVFYRKHRVPVTFVGHPLLDIPLIENKTPDIHTIGFLPGSREGEITRHLPVMLKSVQILNQRQKDLKFLISLAPSLERSLIEKIFAQYPSEADIEIVSGTAPIFEKASLVVAASGTVTLETALSGTPLMVMYKVSPLSYRIGRALIKVKHISLVNLVAGRGIVPELIQEQASPENIADTVMKMLGDPAALRQLGKTLSGLRHLLGGCGASGRVAEIAMNMM